MSATPTVRAGHVVVGSAAAPPADLGRGVAL